MENKNRRLRFWGLSLAATLLILLVALAIYFPGRQLPIALTLATGIGIADLQARVDGLEEQAIQRKEMTEADQRFLWNLYTCFAKGARLTIVVRQSSQMMQQYLSGSGQDLFTQPRIFIHSRPVCLEMDRLRTQIRTELGHGLRESYHSADFYMGDPQFFDSFVGLYVGHLFVHPHRSSQGVLVLDWRAEVPWKWPSYESLYLKYGTFHAQRFPIPNARSLIQGSRYSLFMEDGLGGYLPDIGLAKPFLVYSEWQEEIKE